MKKHYIRLEGINLSSVLDDTGQVSVIRGASYQLREVARDLPQWVNAKWGLGTELQAISVGASVGLYVCVCSDGANLAARIGDALRIDPDYRYYTFAVDAVAASGNFRADLEKLVAANRWRQMQMPSVSLAGLDAKASGPCAWNGIRPADGPVIERKVEREVIKEHLSKSAFTRFDAGSKLRGTFYKREAGAAFEELNFTKDLGELSEKSTKANLNGKIAVIYLDGNRFGMLQQHCIDEPKQRTFDDYVQGVRRDYLDAFLNHAKDNGDYMTDDGRLRIEVLMWGGDEILLVVPAWCGLDALSFFFEQSHDWRFDGEPLTHAAGLVFAQHKTPLTRLIKLAKDLAEGIKVRLPVDKTCNGYDYVVLESIDYPTEALERFRERVYREALASTRLPLAAPTSNALRGATKLVGLPKGQCYALARALVANQCLNEVARKTLDRMRKVAGKKKVEQAEQAATDLFADMHGKAPIDSWLWLHAIDLWDYLPGAQHQPKEEQQ